jgi:hypothetical protein
MSDAPLLTLPLSPDSIRKICVDPCLPLEACPVCRELPSHCSFFQKGDLVERDDIPPAARALREFLRFGRGVNTIWVDRCPICYRIYFEEDTYEFLIPASEDYHAYTRIDVEAILRRPELTWIGQGELRYDGARWQMVKLAPAR